MSADLRPFQKARARFRRKMAEAEDDHTTGELNLVPFLDVLVNTMIFLLATAAIAAPRANILATAPYIPPDDTKVTTTGKQKLNLTVAVSRSGFIVGGAGGILSAPDGTRPTIKCSTPLRRGRCPAFVKASRQGSAAWVDRYDYAALTRLAKQIKAQFPKTRQAVLTADGHVPYQVLIKTLDAVRGKPSGACTGADGCLFDRVSFAGGVR